MQTSTAANSRSASVRLPLPSASRYDRGGFIFGGIALKRRNFIVAAAAGATAACSHSPLAPASLRVLSPQQAVLLEAWVETIIPTDQDPGARDAGVVLYIDRQLARKFKRLQPAYRDALNAIDRLAEGRFAGITLEERSELLATMERGEASKDLFPDGGKAAFEMVLAHTMQGFYGSPRHGGNKDYASWKMIGVPPLPVRGRQQYEVKS
ncbi:MAG: gluconate 2-dehydrogenase subunit 3 family protein [Paludibaculum sp.]